VLLSLCPYLRRIIPTFGDFFFVLRLSSKMCNNVYKDRTNILCMSLHYLVKYLVVFFTQSHKGIVLGLLLLFLLCHIRAVDAVDLFCYFFLSWLARSCICTVSAIVCSHATSPAQDLISLSSLWSLTLVNKVSNPLFCNSNSNLLQQQRAKSHLPVAKTMIKHATYAYYI